MSTDKTFEKLARRIERYRDAMVDLQVRLCAIPAVAPSSGGEGEAKKAAFLVDFLKSSGFADIDLIKAPDPDAPAGYRPNVLVFCRGKSPARTVWIMTHTDVVPPGELALWRGNPFEAWVDKGRVYGRGTEDNQQDMIASLFAVKALRDEGIVPPFDIGLAFVADEETGSRKGIGHILRNRTIFRKQDLIVVPDAGNKSGTMIEVAEKSLLWIKFRTIGKQTHGSTPEKGINSFKAASFFVSALNDLYKRYPVRDAIFDPPISTFEPTKKEANVPNVNTIPGEDVFYMDARILPSIDIRDVEKTIRSIAAGIESQFKVKIRTEVQQKVPAAPPTPDQASVVQAIQKAVRAVYRKEARAMGIGGGTVAALFRRAGLPAACWSKIDETAHQPNEHCVIDNMVGDALVYGHIFLQE